MIGGHSIYDATWVASSNIIGYRIRIALSMALWTSHLLSVATALSISLSQETTGYKWRNCKRLPLKLREFELSHTYAIAFPAGIHS